MNALGVMQRCTDLGVRVPHDVSVIGVNDVPMARMAWPPLTTVRAPIGALGTNAINLLFDHVDARHGPAIVVRSSSAPLVVRQTSAAPRLLTT